MAEKQEQEGGRTEGELLSELELSLTVLWNSVRRWMNQRGKASAAPTLSDLDVFLTHLLVYRDRALRATDLAFALSIDDMHLVSYSLRKLVKVGMVSSKKVGKEVFYLPAEDGRAHYEAFLRERSKYLEPAMKYVSKGEHDFESLINLLRVLSGIYEQAARTAASSKGD